MQKNFPLQVGNHAPARVLDLVKRDVNKYVKRERRKELPEGVDFWDFACQVGPTKETAQPVHLTKMSQAIDEAAAASETSIYVEVLSKKGRRTKKSS